MSSLFDTRLSCCGPDAISILLDHNTWVYIDVYACARLALVARSAYNTLVDARGLLSTYCLGEPQCKALTWWLDPLDFTRSCFTSDVECWCVTNWHNLQVLHVAIDCPVAMGFLQCAVRSASKLTSFEIHVDLNESYISTESQDDVNLSIMLRGLRNKTYLRELELDLCFVFEQHHVYALTRVLEAASFLHKFGSKSFS